MRAFRLTLTVALVILGTCAAFKTATAPNDQTIDINTFSNIDYVQQNHMKYEWNIDLKAQKITAKTTIDFTVLQTPLTEVVLDVWAVSGMTCTYFDAKSAEQSVPCVVRRGRAPEQGDELHVDTSKIAKSEGDIIKLAFQYTVNNTAPALKWISTAETRSQTSPEVYSVSQPIYARSLMPCQDTPSAKFTWEATVTVTPSVPFYMSGERVSFQNKTTSGVYKYELQNKTASYQVAIAAGSFKEGIIPGKKTSVRIISHPDLLPVAVKFFRDAPTYFEYLLEYLNTTYPHPFLDVIVLNESFPVDSIENHRTIFLSGSLIKSNQFSDFESSGRASLMHSLINIFFGAEVTHKNWANVFLTHGIATYIERILINRAFGIEEFKQECASGLILFKQTDQLYREGTNPDLEYVTLQPNTLDENPSHAINAIVYEKGFLLMRWIEQHIGQNYMREFLQTWLQNHTNESVDAQQFQDALSLFVQGKFPQTYKTLLSSIMFDMWTTSQDPVDPDILEAFELEFKTQTEMDAMQVARQFVEFGGVGLPLNYEDIFSWNSNQLAFFFYYFVEEADEFLRNPRARKVMRLIDETFDGFSGYIIDVQSLWITVALRTTFRRDVDEQMNDFLDSTGNLDLILSVYQALGDTFEASERALIYKKHEQYYHPSARVELKRVLKIR